MVYFVRVPVQHVFDKPSLRAMWAHSKKQAITIAQGAVALLVRLKSRAQVTAASLPIDFSSGGTLNWIFRTYPEPTRRRSAAMR